MPSILYTLILALLPVVASAQADDHQPARWAGLIGAQVADAVSTDFMVRQGVKEGNRFLKSTVDKPVLFYSLKVGSGVITAVMLDRVARQKPQLANALTVGIVVAYGLIVVRNLVVGFERRGINARRGTLWIDARN